MGSLLTLSRVFGEMGAVAEEANVGMKVIAFSERGMEMEAGARHTGMGTAALVNDEQKAITMASFFMLLVVFLFLATFLGFLISRRSNPRLLNNRNIQGEQPDEEVQQMLVGNSSEANLGSDHHDHEHRRYSLSTLQTKLNFGKLLALVNFILEIPSAVFDQIASDKKAAYILIVMLLAFASMLVCLVELVCNGRKQRITWKWSNGKIPWFYHPPPCK